MVGGNASAGTQPAAEEHGASLLVATEDGDRLRRRRERPAEVGRYLLLGLGAVCGAAGAALWLTTANARLPGSVFLGFGLTLMSLGGTLHLVLARDRQRWPEQVHAWDEGIELLLHDGELRAATWDDPRLALDLFVRPRRTSSDEDRLLLWRMGPSVPPCNLSEAGYSRLMEMVVKHELRLTEYRRGRRTREPRAYEIRSRPDRPGLASPTMDAGEPHPTP